MGNNSKTTVCHSGFIKTFLALFIAIVSFNSASGQIAQEREEAPPIRDRIFFGGSFGLQFGTYSNIEILPVVGLWVLPRINVAVGPGYRFYKIYDDKTSIFSARAYTQLFIIRDIGNLFPSQIHTGVFFQCEDEVLSLDSEYWRNVSYSPNRFSVNTVLVGAGLSQQIGRRASLDFIVLWPLNESDYNIYGKPELRFGFIF
jgi:hypothetical protein